MRKMFVLIYNDTIEAVGFVLAWVIMLPLLAWYKVIVPVWNGMLDFWIGLLRGLDQKLAEAEQYELEEK